jgi:hypothetical protein
MSEIFISHATSDKPLVQALVKLLRNGVGVPKNSIFCTSLKGHGVPPGEDFNRYMQTKIQAPKMVIMLMTPSYLESQFCLMETGAVWARSLKAFPIVVPPVSFAAITRTLGLVQGWNVTDEEGLVDLKSAVRKAFVDNEGASLSDTDEHDWMDARQLWIDGLDDILEELQGASSVSAADHNKLRAELDARKRQISDLEQKVKQQEALIKDLESAKDDTAVRQAKRQHLPNGDEEEFELLLKAVDAAKPEHASRSVLLNVLMDYFDKAGSFDWWNDREDLQRALDYNIIASDDERTWVNWSERKMQTLHTKIGELVDFLNSVEGQALVKDSDDDIPMDPTSKGFWEYHLNL